MPDTITRTLALPLGYRATFRFAPATGALHVDWAPAVPSIQSRRHRRKFFEAYQVARRSFFKDVATTIGGNVAVVDLTGDVEVVQPGTKH